MSMDGVGDLHTVNMWSDREGKFTKDDEVNVECTVIWPEGFRHAVYPGAKFRLWDGGYFADGVVMKRYEAGWDVEKPTFSGIKCARCGAEFGLVMPDSEEDSLKILHAHRENSALDAIRLLREATGCDLRDAKAFMMHVSKDSGHCHRCNGPISEEGIVECEKCNSTNIHLNG